MKKTYIKILIVDDDEDIVIMLKDFISSFEDQYGLEIRSASTGVDAISSIKDFFPDVMLTDVIIPGTDGSKLASVMREYCPSSFIIGMSGFSNDDRRIASLGKFYDAFLKKPFELEEFEAIFQNAFKEMIQKSVQ